MLVICSAALAAGCGVETLSGEYRTVVAPVAKTLVERGGNAAETQAAKLLQTGQVKLATESANLRETAKVQAATAAGALIDTAQAELVTQAAGGVTAAPTQLDELSETAQAFAATQAAQGIPFVATQAARLLGTVAPGAAEKLLPTLLPPSPPAVDEGPPPVQVEATLLSPVEATPAPPGSRLPTVETGFPYQLDGDRARQQRPDSGILPARVFVVYNVEVGDTIEKVAAQFGTPAQYLIWLNQIRFSWLMTPPHVLLPGSNLVILRQPDDPENPLYPPLEPPWSVTPGCNVSQVDWLQPPIECYPAVIDVVTRVGRSFSCITWDNPLGETAIHQIIDGWTLRGADGAISYGWFIDRGKNSVIVGPAIIAGTSTYQQCGKKMNR